MTQLNPKLESLLIDASYNVGVGAVGVAMLAAPLPRCSKLKALHLDGVTRGAEAAPATPSTDSSEGDAAVTAPATPMSAAGEDLLAALVSEELKLESLSLGLNSFSLSSRNGSGIIAPLRELLERASRLTQLYLPGGNSFRFRDALPSLLQASA